MNYVIAIDVGVKNLGICVFDFRVAKIVLWDCVPIVKGKYMPSRNVEYVREFVRRYESYFENATAVLIERQMRCNMRIIEAVLQQMFYDVCIIVPPRNVKLHYDISTRSYYTNKLAAIDWVRDFVTNNELAFVDGVQSIFKNSRKRDDLADSLMLVLYYLHTYSTQLDIENLPLYFILNGD